jgi:hypothetical protein
VNVLGLDVGGANLKAAHTSGIAASRAFALWKDPAGLPAALRELLSRMPLFEAVAVTMTGELCDCFASRSEGVLAILDAVDLVRKGKDVRLWTVAGTFADADYGREAPLDVASANWLALATYAGRFAPDGPALLLDVGTTTTDIVPILAGRPVPKGRWDRERLTANELIYRGWRRTPLCALMPRGAAELFATMHDVCLLQGLVPEDERDQDTADGRPATRTCAARRLCRMWCEDLDLVAATYLASELLEQFVCSLATTLIQVADRALGDTAGACRTVILSGSGEFLGRKVIEWAWRDAERVSLNERLGPAVSAAACAWAVAKLCQEREGTG